MKTVSTDRRRITAAVMLGLAVAACCVVSAAGSDKPPKEYGLIFGTAYGPDDHPMYGVHVTIHPEGKKHPSWELYSDHRGEFAQRVPPGPADYVVNGVIEVAPIENGKPKMSKKKRLKGGAKVHLDGQERHDFSLHMAE